MLDFSNQNVVFLTFRVFPVLMVAYTLFGTHVLGFIWVSYLWSAPSVPSASLQVPQVFLASNFSKWLQVTLAGMPFKCLYSTWTKNSMRCLIMSYDYLSSCNSIAFLFQKLASNKKHLNVNIPPVCIHQNGVILYISYLWYFTSTVKFQTIKRNNKVIKICIVMLHRFSKALTLC